MSVKIGFGIANFPFSDATAFWRWVDRLENSEADSIWQTDRLASPQPFLESMSLMAALAGRTRRLKFGMNVVVLPFRDPLVLAKECATIDYLSAGRFLPAFGVGGAIAPEFAATGRPLDGRGAIADEMLTIMQRLWTEDHVTVQGKHFQYTDVTIAPKPVQSPLPCWIGGQSPAAVRRTARLGTGWLAGLQTPAEIAPVVAAIAAESQRIGRPMDPDHYGAGLGYRFGAWDDSVVDRQVQALARRGLVTDPRQYLAVGDAAAIRARIDQYRAAGISKFILRPLAEDDADLLGQTERLLAEVVPGVQALRA